MEGADFAGAFEHHVLEVMRETGCFGGVLFRTRSDSDIGEDTRFSFVDTHV